MLCFLCLFPLMQHLKPVPSQNKACLQRFLQKVPNMAIFSLSDGARGRHEGIELENRPMVRPMLPFW